MYYTLITYCFTTASMDYYSKAFNITFEASNSNSTPMCFSVALIDDNIPEVNKSFNITVTLKGIVKDTTMVLIGDGDGKSWSNTSVSQ